MPTICENKVLLQGYVDGAVDIKYFSHNLVSTNFKLRTEEPSSAAESDGQTYTQWHHIIAWGDLAEHIGHSIHTGDVIRVYGQIRYHRESRRDGYSQLLTQISAQQIELIQKASPDHLHTEPAVAAETNDLPWESYAPSQDEDPMA